jgi:hypothetical protein
LSKKNVCLKYQYVDDLVQLIKTKGIVKEEPVCLNYQSVDDLVQLIKTKGIVNEERYV